MTRTSEWVAGDYRVEGRDTFFVRPDGSAAWAPSNGTAFAQLAMGQDGLLITNTLAQVFTLCSIDLAEYGVAGDGSIRIVEHDHGSYSMVESKRIMFLGQRANGAVVSFDYELDGVIDGAGAGNDFETVSLPDSFTGLLAVVIAPDGVAVDNIALDYDGDIRAPDDVGGLTATLGDRQISLAWVNPANPDLTDAIVLRGTVPLASVTLSTGVVYSVGDSVGAGSVVRTGSGGMLLDQLSFGMILT